MNVCSLEEDDQTARDRPRSAEGGEATNQEEFDFVDQPTEEFFCPVTFELLLNPHQTTCCGHHLSEKAVTRLQREDKPCPMCKESKLVTMPDKFFKRKASAVLIRCSYKESECEWVGEVGGAKQHTTACPKRPWECEHCDFTSTFDVGVQHVELCTKYPVPCPNKCEIGTVPRCDVEKHRTECPLESVACDFVDIGCNMKVARKDLKQHIEESQQHHLLSATLLNLKLTKETITELNRQLIEKEHKLDEKEHQLEEKDHQLVQKDKSIAAKDMVIAEKDAIIFQKDEAFAMMVAEKDRIIAEKEAQLSELKEFRQKFMESTNCALDQLLEKSADCGGVLEEFSTLQKKGIHGDWFSNPFSVGEYDLKLNLETREQGPKMKIRLCPNTGTMCRSATFGITLQLLNQLGNHSHYSKKFTIKLRKRRGYSDPYDFIAFQELYRRDRTVQYLKEDSIKLRIWINLSE